ncbi:MAG: aminotransferase class I/II-fold pyridoxal phosphate-dependent enzyme [Rhizobiales bacterium]|nr:aminotransferase class I/II-fold pyridoxal phosphate-dependent enzyme [Hyphomicrobiales bacterium]
MTRQPLAFIDLNRQQARIRDDLDKAIASVLAHGSYVMGPEVRQLESELAKFCGAKHALSCSNGTDALGLILRALQVKPGDAVFCPSFTFAATAEVVVWFGATPVFVDIHDDTFNMDACSLDVAVQTAKALNLRPAGVISVDLFGLPADYDNIEPVCAAHGLWLLSDAAQSFGATYKGRKLGTIGIATGTSFFPAKPLGCYGDGGAIFTDDDALADLLVSLRVHGQGSDKYDNVNIGINGRLDTLQAAVLLQKLRIFPDEIEKRNQVAERYNAALADVAIVPRVPRDLMSVWAQYTIRIPPGRRAPLAAALKQEGVPTAIYYPKPLHRQIAYRAFPTAGNGLPVSDRVAEEVISLPMHPYLEPDEQDFIANIVRAELS